MFGFNQQNRAVVIGNKEVNFLLIFVFNKMKNSQDYFSVRSKLDRILMKQII